MSTENPFVFKQINESLWEVLYDGSCKWGSLEYLASIGWHFYTEENRLTATELAHISLKLFELDGK